MGSRLLNNRYQILSTLKEGGFGIIYKGYDSVLGKDIIIKEIRPQFLSNQEIIKQFQQEAQHVAKMNHQNIVHIFDLVEDNNHNHFMVMEYIDGLDLGTLIQKNLQNGELLPQQLTLHIIAEVCKALDYAHNCRNSENNEPLRFVHQDISPSNIMITKNGIVKLIDFGLTGMQQQSIKDENYLVLRGKVHYMSPEHVNPEETLDRRADIFSLGLVLYEALEGKRFFHLQQTKKIIESLRNGKLKNKDFKHTPRPLRKILQKALAKPKSERYQNANQLYIDLITYLASNLDSTAVDEELAQYVRKTLGESAISDDAADHRLDDIILDDSFENIPRMKPLAEPPQTQPGEGHELQAAVHDSELGRRVAEVEFEESQEDNELEGGDDVKTVIDVIRLSERGHKKLFARGAMATAAILVVFFLVDILFQWTAAGAAVYDFIFPPAIKITSIPSGAKVYLNNQVQDGTTPLAIDQIQPGVYELKLVKDRYQPIIKSLIIPRKGDIKVQGEQDRRGNQPYSFRFKTSLQINSTPPDADVYINNIKYGLRTPCTVTWEIGEHCEISLKKAGFEDLTGFSLDTENMIEQIDDRRLWKFEIENQPTIAYKIDGLFGKHITINSKPSNAAIYINDNPDPIGKTGKKDKIFLTAAEHKITLKKNRYNSAIINLTVNEETPEELFASLTRPIKFVAYDATNGKNEDLKATLTKLQRKGKIISQGRQTPFELNLIPDNYTATFTKAGYKTVTVNVSRRDEIVVGRMEPLFGQFSIIILDEENMPISNVELRVSSLDNPQNTTVLFEKTDSEGSCSGELAPGLYLLRTRKNGYDYHEQSFMITSANLNLIELNLTKSQ